MNNEMIERVAIALEQAAINASHDKSQPARQLTLIFARAALDEIRETLTSMLLCELAHPSGKYHGMRFEHAIPMMIDAVLSPPLAHGEASEVRDDREG